MNAPAMGGPMLARWIRELYKQGKIYKFYKTKEWVALRDRVLSDNHYECEDCLKRGIYTRAVLVHHDQEVRDRPDLALSYYYRDAAGELHKNLFSLCFTCHEVRHDRAWVGQSSKPREPQLNVERW